jgi:hypothetical protein
MHLFLQERNKQLPSNISWDLPRRSEPLVRRICYIFRLIPLSRRLRNGTNIDPRQLKNLDIALLMRTMIGLNVRTPT